jgi:hypothetical protein
MFRVVDIDSHLISTSNAFLYLRFYQPTNVSHFLMHDQKQCIPSTYMPYKPHGKMRESRMLLFDYGVHNKVQSRNR